MSVELGSEPMMQAEASTSCGSRGRYCRPDVTNKSWRAQQMEKLARKWNVDVYDIDESFPAPTTSKNFIRQLLLSARFYPKNVIVPLIYEAREERRQRKPVDRSSRRHAHDEESFLPCDVARALDRASDTLSASQVIWHPKKPSLRWPIPLTPSPGRTPQPKAESEGTPTPVVSDLLRDSDSCWPQGVTGGSEVGEGQTRTDWIQRDEIGVGEQENSHDTLYQTREMHRPQGDVLRDNIAEYTCVSNSNPQGGNVTFNDRVLTPSTHEPSQQNKNRAPTYESDSEVFIRRRLRKSRHRSGKDIILGVDSRLHSKDTPNHPDAIPTSRRLTIPSDERRLRVIISRIEEDETMCFKMRWYVARHVRREWRKHTSRQLYRRRVGEGHKFRKTSKGRNKLVALRRTPVNRLDFEATRAHESFYKDQPGWEDRAITQILQSAYRRYRWNDKITNENVDRILLGAGADLTLFDNAQKSTGSKDVTPPRTPDQKPMEVIDEIESSPEPHLGTSERGLNADSAAHSSGKVYVAGRSTPERKEQLWNESNKRDREMSILREEIRELKAQAEKDRLFKEAFIHEQKASQDALLVELRMMREATEGNKKRPSFDQKRMQRKKDRKLRKYLRKLKELEAEDEASSASSSSE